MAVEISGDMIYGRDYIVVICSYEGVNNIFGPFSYHEALAFHDELKKDCTKEYDITYDYETPDSVIDLIWEVAANTEDRIALTGQFYYHYNSKDDFATTKYGIDHFLKDPDQICIMKPAKRREFVCCCSDFPDSVKNKKPWLMG